ncbi:hypothetical protein DFH08DRAFT_979688 [Mycena albidolilacea]|uniref:Uncharacterized protein n=1 Tax=Mycena albidolilacea TaxID=1033008 RepID=A0AAD6YW95_9AGAR|nr:hypothetical protein DFH08DRAFT_979688 [Mycena albidolilacea]
MSNPLGRTPYLTCAAVRSGIRAETDSQHGALTSVSHSSVAGPLDGALLVDLGEPKSRPVSPELLYSRVVSASPSPERESGAFRSTHYPRDSTPISMPAPELTDNVDFGLLDPDEGLQSWTRVNKKTAKSHCKHSASPTSPVLNPSTKMNSDLTSPVVQATQGMSPEQLMRLARRYEQLVRQASEARSAALLSSESELRTSALLADESHGDTNHHVDGQPDEHVEISDVMPRKIQFTPTKPVDRGEGTSRTKGKGPDLRN